jgi:hypothetical protein
MQLVRKSTFERTWNKTYNDMRSECVKVLLTDGHDVYGTYRAMVESEDAAHFIANQVTFSNCSITVPDFCKVFRPILKKWFYFN